MFSLRYLLWTEPKGCWHPKGESVALQICNVSPLSGFGANQQKRTTVPEPSRAEWVHGRFTHPASLDAASKSKVTSNQVMCAGRTGRRRSHPNKCRKLAFDC